MFTAHGTGHGVGFFSNVHEGPQSLSKNNKIEFNEVLAYGDKKNVELGSPLIKGAKIEAELIKNSKEINVLVFKKSRTNNSKKKYGHRLPFTLIRINKIFSKDGKILASAEKKTEKTLKVIKEDEKKKTIIKKKK